MSEEWESLPNEYSNTYVTNSNDGWIYQKGIVSLLPDADKSYVLNHIDRIETSNILPYSSIVGGPKNGDIPVDPVLCLWQLCIHTAVVSPTTSHLESGSIYQVFRGSWNDDADWLSLVTWNKESGSNRDMVHNDQLSVEYYSHGDLLLADAGEQKVVLDKLYGYYDIHHNTVAIEDPRTHFPVSPSSGSASQGIFKGDAGGLVTPATVDTVIQLPWMELIKTQVTISQIMVGEWGASQSLTTPIAYERTILFPEKDYFVIVDRLQGTQPWTYRNIFRPTSLVITPTTDTNGDKVYTASEVGHVNGALNIGSIPFNWQSLAYKTETKTNITTNSVSWTTTNPYGNAVKLNILSTPASEILVTKHVGRIAGVGTASEVYSPIVYMKNPPANNLYRITALLSNYNTEEEKLGTPIAVTGTGNALTVHSSQYDDYIYTGSGNSSFASFTTDADTVFIRQIGNTFEIILVRGSYLNHLNEKLVEQSKKVGT